MFQKDALDEHQTLIGALEYIITRNLIKTTVIFNNAKRAEQKFSNRATLLVRC